MLDLPQKFDFNGQSVAWGGMGDGDPVVPRNLIGRRKPGVFDRGWIASRA